MAAVTIENLAKSYVGHSVMENVSLSIGDGDFTVLVGPSGCGKSTLLRMIAGLEDITAGAVRIGDRVVNGLPPKNRDIAMVFQNYALYPHMTVHGNMEFSLRLRGEDVEKRKRRVEEAATILGLNDLLGRYPRELSGGQRQRVAMGRAIVRDPQVFLFDEPLSNLDAKLRVQMRAEIKALHQRLGSTVVYVTHDQVEAMTMADKIVVMRAGKVEQVGQPIELYDRPANSFVAGFIGSPSMNFIAGQIDRSGAFLSGDIRLELRAPRTDLAGGEVYLGIRPEHFELAPDGTPNTIKANVMVVEPTGSETMILFRAEQFEFTALFRERLDLKPGEFVQLRPDMERSHLFRRNDGDGCRIP